MILMCKNVSVYDINTQKVYNSRLLPGLMQKNPCSSTFKMWFGLRYSSNTNSIARQLKGVVFGQGNRMTINRITHALSLSDSYWIKDEDEQIDFEVVSPYCSSFWTGQGLYNNESIPTLYVNGYLNKEWISAEILYKYGKETSIERECYNICLACNIPCAKIEDIENGVAVFNITNTNLMLEQADMSGRIDPDDFTENDIIRLFGLQGVQMLVIDAIVGNGDRHAGNFGWLRNTNTGEYVCMSPLYDFDHALDSKLEYDRLIGDVLDCIKGDKVYQKECYRIAKIVSGLNTNEIFKKRAKTILKYLDYNKE